MFSDHDLFQRYREELLRYLYQLTGSVPEAEDLAQETYVRYLERDEEVGDPRAWLFAVATNLVRDRARVERRRQELDARRSEPQPSAPADERAEARWRLAEVWSAIDRLPDRDRALLLLRVEGFSYREIAEVLDVARGSVGPLTGRALRRLKEKLDRQDPQSEGRP